MSDDLGPLPPAIASLIAREREAPGAPTTSRANVHARLLGTLGLAAVSGTAAAASTGASTAGAAAGIGITGKIVTVVLLVGALGGGIAIAVRGASPSSASPASPAPSPSIATTTMPSASTTATAVVQEIATPAPQAPPTVARKPAIAATVKPSAAPELPPTPSQRELMRDAWRLSKTEPLRALEILESDARDHRDGSLAEERDALRVVLLRRLQRQDEADELARAFAAKYPNSVHRALVETP